MRKYLSLLATVCFVSGATLASSCRTAPPSHPVIHAKPIDLPKDANQLVTLADQKIGDTLNVVPPLKASEEAVAILLEADKVGGGNAFERAWRIARACFFRAKVEEVKETRVRWANLGAEHATRAIQLNDKRVEGHYFLALNLGKVAEVTRKLATVKQMVTVAEKAVAIDSKYYNAGGLAFLGKVYLTAPAWPVSVGDSEKAVDVLEQAVKIAPVPVNRVFLGEAYYHNDDQPRAEKELSIALKEAEQGASLDKEWADEAREYLKKISQ